MTTDLPWDYCADCGHRIEDHEDGVCRMCQDEMDTMMPGGAQGANVSSCPSLETDGD